VKRLALLAALALALVPWAMGGSATKTIGTRGEVVEISADGSRVAIHATVDGDPDCHSGSVWQPGEVHLLTIATNRNRVVARQKGLVQADLEPAGLYYAYNVPGGGTKPGRVTFVPASALRE
jgi:hypothetical protein